MNLYSFIFILMGCDWGRCIHMAWSYRFYYIVVVNGHYLPISKIISDCSQKAFSIFTWMQNHPDTYSLKRFMCSIVKLCVNFLDWIYTLDMQMSFSRSFFFSIHFTLYRSFLYKFFLLHTETKKKKLNTLVNWSLLLKFN